jgi:hypothetical protein
MIASHAFKLRSHKESVDCLQWLVAKRRIRTLAAHRDPIRAAARARSGPHDWRHGGVQTFAGFGEIAFDRYRQPTGALGGTTELLGLSRDRQNRCQYANDLKWPARPPQASPHNLPPKRRTPRLTQRTHTKGAADPATSHTAIAALANRTRCNCHTCPARTFGKDGQALGRLYDSGRMIPWRRSPIRRFGPWAIQSGNHRLP